MRHTPPNEQPNGHSVKPDLLPLATIAPLGPERPRDLRDLFWSINALSLQGFGGVLAVVQRVLVDQRRWYTPTQFVEAWAVAQVMPGPNIINLCADLGARYFGVRGILVAIAGLLAMPFCIAIALSALYTYFADVVWVAGAVRGMAAVSAGIIISAGLRLSNTLNQHVLGAARAIGLAIAGFVMVGLLRWTLSAVLLGLGFFACVLTWRALSKQTSEQTSDQASDQANELNKRGKHG